MDDATTNTEPDWLDCFANTFIRCPYCSWRFDPDEGVYYCDDFKSMTCGKCEREFVVEVEHTTTWTTRKREISDG